MPSLSSFSDNPKVIKYVHLQTQSITKLTIQVKIALNTALLDFHTCFKKFALMFSFYQ